MGKRFPIRALGKQEYTFGKGESAMGKREYTFAEGGRPRMGKREPVEEVDSLDRGVKHLLLLPTFASTMHQKI